MKKFELLAPGGDIESIKAAIVAGADAVYCGLNHFNARNRASNIEIGDLPLILHLAHANQCKVFLTINILIIDNEFKSLFALLNKLVNTTLDGVIVQDLGLLYLLSIYFPSLEVHASTQLTTHNDGQVKFLNQLGVARINLCRELNIDEISKLVAVGRDLGISSEVFVHGSYCIGFSGICYLSSVLEGKSGNRGRCSQHCRDQYQPTPQGMSYPLNLKDNSAFNDLQLLSQIGVDALKIEGRMKKFHYVYTVVDAWRKLLDNFYATGKARGDDSALYRVFNRTFTNGFLSGNINNGMFIDNPRDSSALHFSEKNDCHTDGISSGGGALSAARTVIIEDAKKQIEALSVKKIPLNIKLSGHDGDRLLVKVVAVEMTFSLRSKSPLVLIVSSSTEQQKDNLCKNGFDSATLRHNFETLDEVRFSLNSLDVSNLAPQVFLPLKELTVICKKILTRLNRGPKNIEPVILPRLTRSREENHNPRLAVLISSVDQLSACSDSSATIYFQLPSCFHHNLDEYIVIFSEQRRLIPWFPAIIVGDNYTAAVELLQQLQPKRIVTNNSGIAFEAYKQGIAWVAGPYLNCINSYSLRCLQQKFNCSGAFISNELSRAQIKMITKPEGFDLYHSIYHSVMLLTSRQCLLQQIEGCEKKGMDEDCSQNCTRSATIKNMKNETIFVAKSKGGYHSLYHSHNLLNSDIVTDLPGLFSGFLIDLSLTVKNETIVRLGNASIIALFEKLLAGEHGAKEELAQVVQSTTNTQYHQGI